MRSVRGCERAGGRLGGYRSCRPARGNSFCYLLGCCRTPHYAMVGKNDEVLRVGVHTETHDGIVSSRCTVLLGVVGECCLVAMMAVRNYYRRGSKRVPKHVDLGRRAHGPQSLEDACVVGETGIRGPVGK